MLFLDTDVMIDLLRQYPPAVAWLASLGDEELALSGFVVMELLQGCRNRLEQERVERGLTAFRMFWPTTGMCDEALAVFSLTHLSSGIGLLDAVIGQMAAAWNIPLCTFDQKHYSAIPGLQLLQPYAKGG